MRSRDFNIAIMVVVLVVIGYLGWGIIEERKIDKELSKLPGYATQEKLNKDFDHRWELYKKTRDSLYRTMECDYWYADSVIHQRLRDLKIDETVIYRNEIKK